MFQGDNRMMYKITQALNDLKNYYGLTDFHEVNLNMENIDRPFIKFKSNDDEEWILILRRNRTITDINEIHEEGENGVL